MWRDGRPILGRGGYILGTDHKDFYNVGMKEPRMSTDHGIILADLKEDGVRSNCRYFKVRSIWTIEAPK